MDVKVGLLSVVQIAWACGATAVLWCEQSRVRSSAAGGQRSPQGKAELWWGAYIFSLPHLFSTTAGAYATEWLTHGRRHRDRQRRGELTAPRGGPGGAWREGAGRGGPKRPIPTQRGTFKLPGVPQYRDALSAGAAVISAPFCSRQLWAIRRRSKRGAIASLPNCA